MRIAYINSVSGYGSTGKLVEMLAKTEGQDSRIYYGRKSDTSGCDTFRITGPLGFGMHVISTFLLDNHAFFNTGNTKRMIRDLKRFQPDIIHLHNLHGYYLDVAPLFSYLKESKTKVIWTLHDCWPFTGHCAHYTSVHCGQWQEEGCTDCPAIHHYPPTFNPKNTKRNFIRKKALFTSLDKDQVTIVTPSLWLKQEAELSFLGKYRVICIPNGIDQTVFYRRESTFRKDHHIEDKFMVLAVAGNWYAEKGTDDIIAASKVVHKDVVLVVVGAKGDFAKKLERDNVIVIERTENTEKLAEIYSAADVMINPTREDTFPTVNIEAQACGCPVITYNVGGSPEILRENTGIVVEAEKTRDLLTAMSRIRLKEIQFDPKDCMENAKQYTREEMLGKYRELYLQIKGS